MGYHFPTPEVARGRGKYGATTALSIPGVGGTAQTSLAHAANIVFYFPIIAHTPITIGQVTIEVTTAATAGKKCRFAVYDADINWQPVARKVASAEIAIDAIAVVNTALTSTILQPGRYLEALTLQEAATLRCIYGTEALAGFNPDFSGTPLCYGLTIAKAYAALADPGTAWGVFEGSTSPFRYPCLLQITTP
mgnify:CR=1 FL=1